MYTKIVSKVIDALKNKKNVTFLTGAGISSESGLPTFRGKDGYWIRGSKNYKAEEIATLFMYKQDPREVWRWYLHRNAIYHKAQPNAGHKALVNIEKLLGYNFALISQNVDGLHLKAGSCPEKSFFIHGDMNFSRCGNECSQNLYPFPDLTDKLDDAHITETEWNQMKCPKCNAMLRPHILWFDEYYNEHFYKMDTVMQIAQNTDVLFTIGTAGATSLPNRIVNTVQSRGKFLIDINTDENVFSSMAQNSGGIFLKSEAGTVLSELFKKLKQELM